MVNCSKVVTCGILPWKVTLILVSNQLRLQSNLLSTSAAASQSKRKGRSETSSRTSKRTKLFQAETTKNVIPSSTEPKQGQNNPIDGIIPDGRSLKILKIRNLMEFMKILTPKILNILETRTP